MQTVLLHYAAPPLLGAFIGYLTNKVAIKMLFRPLKPWHILGFRVPMTPGVIPSKRHDLAVNMGEMVGEHLLTASDIGAALSEERFQDHLHLIVDSSVHDLLAKDLGPIISVVPKRFRSYVKIGIRTLKYQMRQGLHEYILSEDFADTAAIALNEQLARLGEKDLESVLSSSGRDSLYKVFDTFVANLLSSPQAVDQLAAYIEKSLVNAAVQGKTLADLLPAALVEIICDSIAAQTPQVLRQLMIMLEEPAVFDKVVQAVKDGVDNFLDTLGPMGAMARGFVDMETLDGTIRTYLADKEEDFNAWLLGDRVKERVAGLLAGQIRDFFETPLAELLSPMEPEKMQDLCTQSAQGILTVLRSEEALSSFSLLIKERCELTVHQGKRPLSELAQGIFKDLDAGKLQNTLARELIGLLRSQQVGKMVDQMLNSMVDQLTARPVGILQNFMPLKVRKAITDYIVLTANRMLLKEVPGLVDSLNIREIVTVKVDSLDLLRLERLLLSIMEEQFKYINIFGGFLGFLIGLINLLVLL